MGWCPWEAWTKCSVTLCQASNGYRIRKRGCNCEDPPDSCKTRYLASHCKYSIECRGGASFQIMGLNYYYFLLIVFLVIIGLIVFLYCCRSCMHKLGNHRVRRRTSRRRVQPHQGNTTVTPRQPASSVSSEDEVPRRRPPAHDLLAARESRSEPNSEQVIASYPMWSFQNPPEYTELGDMVSSLSTDLKLPTYEEAMEAQIAADREAETRREQNLTEPAVEPPPEQEPPIGPPPELEPTVEPPADNENESQIEEPPPAYTPN